MFGIISKKYICSKNLIKSLVEKYERHTVYIDGVTNYDEACNVLRLKHYLHSPFQKSLMERNSQPIF
jgi:putative transposase